MRHELYRESQTRASTVQSLIVYDKRFPKKPLLSWRYPKKLTL
jgi:hypothetical protein